MRLSASSTRSVPWMLVSSVSSGAVKLVCGKALRGEMEDVVRLDLGQPFSIDSVSRRSP